MVEDIDDGLQEAVRAQSAVEARKIAIDKWTKTRNYSGSYGRRVWSPTSPTIDEKYR